ncbi:MAG: ABC transporter substrate-binding protein, partial [Pseudomonadota bacterium]|nr:ABC transporter substrate-binding protein [Pseudomonadota bacterium]
YRADGEKDTIVTSFIIPDQGSEIQIDWRVRYKDGKYKVIDIIVEGVSMSVTQRSDFSSVIQRGGGNVQVLIDHLREKTKG